MHYALLDIVDLSSLSWPPEAFLGEQLSVSHYAGYHYACKIQYNYIIYCCKLFIYISLN